MSDETRQKFRESGAKRYPFILSKICSRPNKFEKRCGNYLNKLFPDKFRYVGDGSVVIKSRFPDYISDEMRIVVLCNGLYWHLLRKGLKDTQKNRLEIELYESLPYRDAGYEVWFIWEDSIHVYHKHIDYGMWLNKINTSNSGSESYNFNWTSN